MKRLMALTIMAFMVFVMSMNTQAARYTFEVVSGDNQTGVAGEILNELVKVKVTLTLNGRAIEDKGITFSVASSGGRFVRQDVITDRRGIAKARIELGPGTGVQTFTASMSDPVQSVTISALSIVNVLDQHVGGSGTSRVWQKYIGEISDDTVPDIVDYSYAGYGSDGSESIPRVHNFPIYDITSYGAIPNDGLSDSAAIRAVFLAARGGNAVVFFPAGHYDIFMDNDGDSRREIRIGSVGSPVHNIIVKGGGGQGSKLGGTTIQMHNDLIPSKPTWGYALFNTVWISSGPAGSGASSRVSGTFPRGTKYFDVEDASSFIGKQYIKIQAGNLTGDDWDAHSSRPKTDMRSNWDLSKPNNNMYIQEKHEIDRVVGNRIHVKKATLTPLNSNYVIYSLRMHSGIGFEDLHLDCGFNNPVYEHVVHEENGGIKLNNAANSWIKHCRITNTTSAVQASSCYAVSIIGIIIDGSFQGHYDATVISSSFVLIAMLEDHTRIEPKVHGIHVSTKTAGTVAWRVGGSKLRGPDGHGGAPRYSLFDNCFTLSHDANSGSGSGSPHHLDGYVRWNNHSDGTNTIDYWYWRDAITEAILVGFVAAGGSTPVDAYSESFGARVSIDSLYVAQLTRRLGYTPRWLTDEQSEYRVFHNSIYARKINNFTPVFDAPTHVLYGRTSQIQQAVVDALDHRNNVADVTAEDLLTLTRLKAENKGIEELRVGDFAGMSNLLDLYLSNNDIETVSNDLFTGLDSLKHIYLDGNPLGTVPRDLFSGMTSLELISFWNTGLTTVHKNLFRGLTNLISVRLGHNEIVHIPNTLFPNGSKIIYLDLRRNNLGRIPVNSLNNLNKLQTLQMSENNLGRINADTFNSLTSLRYLHLDNCNLDSIHLGLFDSLRALEILALNNNNIPLLPIGIFKNNMKLRSLWLQDNNLRRIPNDAFKGLVDIKVLELGDNSDAIEFPVSLVKVSGNTFKISVPYGATFTFDVPLTSTNCILSSDTATVSIGKTESAVITVEDIGPGARVKLGKLPKPPKNLSVNWQTNIFHDGYKLSRAVKRLDFQQGNVRGAPAITKVAPNFPNPFNPETWIPYQLAKPANVSITIYDIRGVVIREIALGIKSAGYYTKRRHAAHWDGKNDTGEDVSSGVYFYQFTTGNKSMIRKMVIMK